MPSLVPNPLGFNAIDNADKKLWRYMDIYKFLSFLKEEALFFSSIKEFEDPFEGYLSKKDNEILKDNFNSPGNNTNARLKNGYVNCWHINEYESAALWRLYSKNDEGIAIQSTCRQLHNSLPNDIFLAEVKYIDYANDCALENKRDDSLGLNIYAPMICKRKSFKHEQELRAIIMSTTGSDDACKGKLIKIEGIKDLVERIYISPCSADWQVELIRNLVHKYCAKFPYDKIVRSELNTSLY